MNEITNRREQTRKRLIQHYQSYPKLEAEDIFKYLFQSAFGCEHFVLSEDTAREYILREYATLPKSEQPKTEPLDGDYSRVHLSHLNAGLPPEALARLFCLSARKEEEGRALLEEKLEVAKELVEGGFLPLDGAEFSQKLAAWRALGYPALHHSNAFREVYRPAYRVIANRYVRLLPVWTQSQKAMQKVIVIGCPGSGKTTFAKKLKEKTGLPLFHLDAIWHKPDKTHVPREEYDACLAEILTLDSWIIDGNYSRTLEGRLAACDTVFLFDLPTEDCLAGAMSRIGKKRDEMPWIETELDPEFKQQIEEFPTKTLPTIYGLLEKYNAKSVFVFKSRSEAEDFLNCLSL